MSMNTSEIDIIREEASIVLVGNFNPKIFHPEWFIRKNLVEEWDYTEKELVNLPDMAQMVFPTDRKLTVLLNKFSLLSTLASDFPSLKDIITSTFSVLRETPIKQLGMNYTRHIKIRGKENWLRFGSRLAPTTFWAEAAGFIENLPKEKQESLGLLELGMTLPRPDDLSGFIRPKISAISLTDYTLSFSVNNHVEVAESSAMAMVRILNDNWEESLDFGGKLISKIIEAEWEK